MIVKNTFAVSGVWKINLTNQSKKIAGPCELSAVKLNALGGSATVALYNGNNSADAVPSKLQWYLDASTSSPDTQEFANPLRFSEGIWAVCEDGATFDPVLSFSVIK